MNTLRFFKISILLILFTTIYSSCNNDTSEIANLDTPTNSSTTLNTWKLAHGNGDNNAYSIGIVFEAEDNTQTDKTFEKLIDRIVGSGDFSLFKTKPFDTNKEKFNIYYAVISKSKSQNKLPYSMEELKSIRKKAGEHFSKNKNIFFNAKEPKEANTFLKNVASTAGFDLNKAQESFFYADGISLVTNNTNSQQLAIINNNLDRFNILFNQKEFDTQVYISPGIGQPYANTDNQTKKIYMGYENYSLGKLVASNLVHPDVFAITFSHEFGHAFSLFSDEYYDYENTLSPVSIKFQNNTTHINFSFKNKRFDPQSESTNPWSNSKIPVLIKEDNGQGIYEFIAGPIPNYNNELIKGGPSGYGGYRASNNSIMRFYFHITDVNDWKNGWNPVQQFYINHFISKI